MNTIGEMISKLIEEKKLKKIDVYSKSGISKVGLDNIIKGINSPTIETLGKIAKVLEVPIMYFLGDLSYLVNKEKENISNYELNEIKDKYIATLEELKKVTSENNSLELSLMHLYVEEKLTFALISNTLNNLSKCDLFNYNIKFISKNTYIGITLSLFLWIVTYVYFEKYKKSDSVESAEGNFTNRKIIESFKEHYQWFIKYKDMLRLWCLDNKNNKFIYDYRDSIKLAFNMIDEEIFEDFYVHYHPLRCDKKLKDY